jgi:hypothetical protein
MESEQRHETERETKPRTHSPRNWSTLILAGILVILFAAVAIVYAMGYVRFGKETKDQEPAQITVCDSGIVDKYNVAWDDMINGRGFIEVDILINDIIKKENYQQDPTCQAMVFSYAIYTGDTDKAQLTLDSLRSMSEEGLFPSINITNIRSITEMDNLIQRLLESREG